MLALATLLVAAPTTHAHFESAPYNYGDGACTQAVDPINFGFYGDQAWASKSSYMFGFHLGWGETNVESGKYFFDHGVCEYQHFARASGTFYQTRFHTRGHRLRERDTRNRWETVTGTHFEDITNSEGINPFPCHAVRENNPDGTGGGFNYARDEARRGIPWPPHKDGWSYYVKYGETSSPYSLPYRLFAWGNTAAFRQCDGQYAWSDGWVDWKSMYSGDGI